MIYADQTAGWLALEWIPGQTIRSCLDHHFHNITASQVPSSPPLLDLMGRVGTIVARLHEIGIVHGDLTTSNLMVKQPDEHGLIGDVYLIDFGLAQQSTQDEDRAVDLYVLERAFGSTHPQAEGLFHEVLRFYGTSYKHARIVLKKLEDVRMRGRKKSMIG
jgi:TP53 regulating kinase and related kinases